MRKPAYGEPGCASSIKRMFEIIRSDPKNQTLLRKIDRAEREFTAFLYDQPNAPSECGDVNKNLTGQHEFFLWWD